MTARLIRLDMPGETIVGGVFPNLIGLTLTGSFLQVPVTGLWQRRPGGMVAVTGGTRVVVRGTIDELTTLPYDIDVAAIGGAR